MALEPALDLGGGVVGQVVQDDMHRELVGHLPVDQVEEAPELAGPRAAARSQVEERSRRTNRDVDYIGLIDRAVDPVIVIAGTCVLSIERVDVHMREFAHRARSTGINGPNLSRNRAICPDGSDQYPVASALADRIRGINVVVTQTPATTHRPDVDVDATCIGSRIHPSRNAYSIHNTGIHRIRASSLSGCDVKSPRIICWADVPVLYRARLAPIRPRVPHSKVGGTVEWTANGV